MITTRRSDSNTISAYESEPSRGNVALLERKAPESSVEDYSTNLPSEENLDEARVRMQDNLAKLLNYDRYSEQVKDSATTVVEAEPVIEIQSEQIVKAQTFAEDDIRPTSTTMQFGDGDIDKMRMDMKKPEEEQTGAYRLNGKGKLVVVLYALVLTVVMALIAINSGLLANKTQTASTLFTQLNDKVNAYNSLQTEIDNISSADYIIDVAENQYGMIK